MGLFDNLRDSYRSWKSERKQKRLDAAQQQQQAETRRQAGSVSSSPSGQHQRSHHSQQVEPALDDENGHQEILVDRAALTLAQVHAASASSSSVPQRVYGAQHPPLSVASHLSQPRSSSPTSLPGGSGQSTPYRPQRIGQPVGLGSSPESENMASRSNYTPSHLHHPIIHSATTTPTRRSHHHHSNHHQASSHQGGFRSADPVSSRSSCYSSSPHPSADQENKEQENGGEEGEDFYGMESELRRRQDQAMAQHASAASSQQSKYETSMTADERFAALLQQQEYLSYCEESGELSKEDARLLEARRQKEERRAVRRLEREREARMHASSSSASSSHHSSPIPPVLSTPSPSPEEDEHARQAQAAFEAFQARAQAVLSGSRPHALSVASLNSLAHGLHSSRVSAAGLSSHDSPSRSQSYSSALPTPPASARGNNSHAPNPALQRTASLSKSEINSLPAFAYVQSPASIKRQAAAESLAAAHLTVTTKTAETSTDATNSTTAITEATLALASAQLLEEEIPSCSICLCDYEVSEKLRALPCAHKYHAICIDDWLQRSSLCPSCNYDCHDAM